MKQHHFGFDYRTRICQQCYGWFLSEGAHSRFCAPCRAEAMRTPELPWELEQVDVVSSDDVAMTAREPVAR